MPAIDGFQRPDLAAVQEIGRLRAEVERLRAGILAHRDQKGDDRCWVDDLLLYALLGKGEEHKAEFTLPPREEFLKSCERYWQQRQTHIEPNHTCLTIRQLEDDRATLRAALQSILDFQPDPRHVLGWGPYEQTAEHAQRECRRALKEKG